jgi:imidazoleglycerol-phosphate dehydratase
VFEGDFPGQAVADLDAGLCEEFLRAVASTAKMTLHVRVETAGGNDHHVVEAAFKAFARALREAVAVDPTETGVPSTKGLL